MKIQRKIMCVIYVWYVWISKKIEYRKLRIFNGKLCTLYMYGMSLFVEKLNVQNCVSWTRNCIHNLYGMSGLVEILYIQNCENSTANFVHYICTEGLDLQKNWISRTAKIQWEIVYIILVWKVWICRKIEYPELRKLLGKLCTLYMYGTSGFAENLNI